MARMIRFFPFFAAFSLFLSSQVSAQCPSTCRDRRWRARRDCSDAPDCAVQPCPTNSSAFTCSERIPGFCPDVCRARRSIAFRDCEEFPSCVVDRCPDAASPSFRCTGIIGAGNGTVAPTPSPSPAGCIPAVCDMFSKRDPDDACACVSLLACDGRQRRRLEYRQLTADQRAAFVRGVKALEASGAWGAISDAHARDFNTIHGLGNFYPWHTGMLFYIETLLMDLEPSLPGLPFFPWGLDSPIRESTMWTSEFIGGSSLSRAPIPNGPFAGFSVDGSVVTRDLFRDSLETATGATIQAVIANEPGYPFWSTTGPSLSDELELLHNIFHIVVGGTMLTGDSPRDPVFYLHHAYVDKWWAQDWPARRGFAAEDEPEEMLAGLPLTRSYANLGGFSLADSVEIQRCVTYDGRTARLVPSSVQSAEEIVGTMVQSPRNVMLLSQLQGTSMAEVEDTVEAIAEAVVSVRRR